MVQFCQASIARSNFGDDKFLTTLSYSGRKAEPLGPAPGDRVDCLSFIHECARRFKCHFTLEIIDGESPERKSTLLFGDAIRNSKVSTIDGLVVHLRDILKDVVVIQNGKNPKIIHLIDRPLTEDPEYLLEKMVDFDFNGHLEDLPDALGRLNHLKGLISPSDELGGSDNSLVEIRLKQAKVREILTNVVPLNAARPILWETHQSQSPDGKRRITLLIPPNKKETKHN